LLDPSYRRLHLKTKCDHPCNVIRHSHAPRRDFGFALHHIIVGSFSTHLRNRNRLRLEANPNYILGERFTAADILLSTCITWAVHYGIPVADSVIAYNARATARPSYARAEQTNGRL
jgi:hypothetical protein